MSHRNGFSMIELAVVLTITGILIVGAVVMMGSMQGREQVRAAAKTLKAELEYARSLAMSGRVSGEGITLHNWNTDPVPPPPIPPDANTISGSTQGGTYRIVRVNNAGAETVLKTGTLTGIDVRFGQNFNETRPNPPIANPPIVPFTQEGIELTATFGATTYRIYLNPDGTIYRGGRVSFFFNSQGRQTVTIDRRSGNIKLDSYIP